MTAAPRAAAARIFSNSNSTRSAVSGAVGSSSTSTFGSIASAFASSMSWRCAMPTSAMRVLRMHRAADALELARRPIPCRAARRAQVCAEPPAACSRPPSDPARPPDAGARSQGRAFAPAPTSAVRSLAPQISMVPASGRTSPDAIPISVDLPAPFSPSSACTSPANAANETSLTATTPPKRFETWTQAQSDGVASGLRRSAARLARSTVTAVPSSAYVSRPGLRRCRKGLEREPADPGPPSLSVVPMDAG